jgi:hypothetical protein
MVTSSAAALPYDTETALRAIEPAEAAIPSLFAAAPFRPRIMLWLLASLPLFGQTFHYISVLPPLWALSKAFPVLSLPLIFRLSAYLRFPMTRQVLLSFGWLVLAPSFAAIFYFHESFFTAITAQVKLLPMLYFFSFLALLLTLQPTLSELARSFIILGAVTTGVLILLWALIPDSWYNGSYVFGSEPFFSSDNRGHRIRMTMYFPIIIIFLCYRRAFFERSFRYFMGAAIAFAVTLLIVKTRAMIIGITGVVLIRTILWSSPLARIGLLLCAPFALVAMFSAGYLASTFSTGADSGVAVRAVTAALAGQFLGTSPLRWMFGVGTLSPTSKESLTDYFHHFFFLADIGWLGVVFEYGSLGALLFILLELRGMAFYRRLRAHVEDDFLGALFDYLLYVLLISFVYPPTLTPGETATILAIFVYVWHAGGMKAPSYV